MSALTQNLMRADDQAFVGGAFRGVLESAERRSARLLISNEALSGNLWGERTALRNAERLATVAPNSRIVLLIRNQSEMISSIYAQFVNEGGYSDFGPFLAGDIKGPRFDFESLEYDLLASRYVELFGMDAVWIAPFELLRADRDGFLRALCEFLEVGLPPGVDGSRVNVSLSPLPMLALRGWNRLFRASSFNPEPRLLQLRGGRTVRTVLQRTVDPVARRVLPIRVERSRRMLAEWGLERYAESNARLSELCRFPLRDLGYVLPSVAGDSHSDEVTETPSTAAIVTVPARTARRRRGRRGSASSA